MSDFWINELEPGYYDKIISSGLKVNKGLRASWHNYTNLVVKDEVIINDVHLDYACGPGTLIGLYTTAKSTGVDISEAQIIYALENYGEKGKFFTTKSKDFRVYERKYNIVTVIGLFEFLDDDEIIKLLNKFYKLLLPGGKVVVTTPNFLSTMHIMVKIQNIIGNDYGGLHINKFSKRKLRKLMAASEFHNIEIRKYMNIGVFLGIFNIRFSNTAQKFIEKVFSDFFGFMLTAKLTK